ncbi:MAG: hypothetical protein HY898_36505 [Deltaproteobacteria bacterium]|nr:hypothetical protein [Deltaproteobacteria bacterium]
MQRLLDVLISEGEIDKAAAEWVRGHLASNGGTVDTALLELDLIDEEGLMRGLEACFGIPAAWPSDIGEATQDIARLVPAEALQPGLCPYRLRSNELTLLVKEPLADDRVDELQRLGLQPLQRIAPAHTVECARTRLLGAPLDARTEHLEERLSRRRNADVRGVVAAISKATSFAAASAEVLDYASRFVEFCCFLLAGKTELRVGAARGGNVRAGAVMPVPDPGCALAAAVRYGGYFVGPLGGSEADEAFYAALSMPMARWALVAPVPITTGQTLVFYADNGPRGMASRWVAELTLLAARAGQQEGRMSSSRGRASGGKARTPPTSQLALPLGSESAAGPRATPEDATPVAPGTAEPGPANEPIPAQAAPAPRAEPVVTGGLAPGEYIAIGRLRAAAASEGVTVEALVDSLLKDRVPPPAAEPSAALVGEVRGLFEMLAVNLPTQLAKGIEAAFRDIVPRLGTPAGAPMPVRRSVPPPPASAVPMPAIPPPAQTVALEPRPQAAKEVPSYADRRSRANRVKL